jgi:carbonic anhydrase
MTLLDDPRPAHRVAVVTCFDARIDPRAALGYDLGDAHIFRNAGGVVTDDVLRSLAISQHMLDTTRVHLIAHTECGLRTSEHAVQEAVAEATHGRPAITWGAFADLESHLREGARRITSCHYLATTSIETSVLDTASGELRSVELEDQVA